MDFLSKEKNSKKADSNESEVDRAAPRKSARRILEQEITEGLGELRRTAGGLFISGLSAGLDVGFSIFLMAIFLSLAGDKLSEPIIELFKANLYAVGFIFVIVGRSELFTEHTTLAVLPVLNGRSDLKALARLWSLVYTSNLLGVSIFAALVVIIGPALGVIDPAVWGEMAHDLVAHEWWIILMSGVLAGWLMGLLSWLVTAGRDTISQIVLVWLVTSAIGFAHLHHSIVGSAEVLAGIFAGQGPSWAGFFHFLLWTTIGNSIGGVFLVAVIKYGHVIRTEKEVEDVELAEPPGETKTHN
ncbi:MAG: formate/nitrite transporter family protein [Ardenticatenaceae bacterium]|nr:formate/nitrite transporter family protein [Ardenticatenaceae bacterium]